MALLMTTGVIGLAAPAQGAGIPKTGKCGNVATANGGQAKYIRAYKTTCAVAKGVAGRANGKRSFKASGFTCLLTGNTYLCAKGRGKGTVVFTYKKP